MVQPSLLMLVTILLFILTPPSQAAEDYYQFSNLINQQRFTTLTTQLRCLVCQNQTLAESNAPLADDLRQQIYIKIQQGQTNQQIIDYLVARYGNFILYSPPLNVSTLGLWFGPGLLLVAGLSYLIFYLRKKSESP